MKNPWHGLRDALMKPPPDPKTFGMADLHKAFYNQTIAPYQRQAADKLLMTLNDYATEGERELSKYGRAKVNARQEELIKLILADVVEKAGGEVIYPLAKLEAMENKHILIEDRTEEGYVKVHLLPPEVMAGMKAARQEEEDRQKRLVDEQAERISKEGKVQLTKDLKTLREQASKYGIGEAFVNDASNPFRNTTSLTFDGRPFGTVTDIQADDKGLTYKATLRDAGDAAALLERVKRDVKIRQK